MTTGPTPTSQINLDALFGQALAAQREGRLAEAAEAYSRILALRPDAAEPYYYLGSLLWRQGKPGEAAAHFQQAIAHKPIYPEAHNDLGILYAQNGQFERAAACFEQAIALAQTYAQAHNNLGNILRERGGLDAAAARYEQAIALFPNYAEAHANLATILAQQGQLSRAAAHYEQAIALAPGNPETHCNLGNVLWQQGQLERAAAHYEQALALRPQLTEAYNNLGNVLWQQGRMDEAAARYEQALAFDPKCAEAHGNLATVLSGQGKFNEAAARYQTAIELKPDYPEAHNGLGYVRASQGQLDAAAASYERAIAVRPNYAEAYNNLGNVFWEKNKLPEAAVQFAQALEAAPNHVGAQNNLGKVFRRQGKLEEAAACCERALTLRPDYAEAYASLGNVRMCQGRLDEALALLEQALAMRPDYAPAHTNLANTLVSQDRLEEAAARYEQALALKPDSAEARMGRAVCCLLVGDYRSGWPGYEARLRLAEAERPPDLPRWQGEPLAGRSLLLVGEQGVGDNLQFIRYARVFKQLGARVVLAVQPALGPLLARGSDWDELFLTGPGKPLPRCDFYLPLLSAPFALGTEEATIPREIPYVAADPDLVSRWREELAGIAGFKIGIVWQGRRDFVLDRMRSMPLAHFAPLARLPDVRLISLQKGFGSEQMARIDFPVLDFAERLDTAAGPFMDTAAVISNLDLVVTSDTAMAHLAGALGARFGWRCNMGPIGVFCASATTRLGIRRCGSSGKPPWDSGPTFSNGSPRPSRAPVGNSARERRKRMSGSQQTSPERSELEALYGQAVGHHRAGRLAEAAAGFRQILARQPDLGQVQNYLGVVLCQLVQFDEALTCFERAIALAPRFADAYNNLGNVLRQLGRLDEAAARYQTAIELKPDYPEAHGNLGSVLLEQGQFERAAAGFERAIAIWPDQAESALQPGQHSAQTKQARTSRGPLQPGPGTTARAASRPTSTWAPCCGSKAGSRQRRPGTCKPWRSTPGAPRH